MRSAPDLISPTPISSPNSVFSGMQLFITLRNTPKQQDSPFLNNPHQGQTGTHKSLTPIFTFARTLYHQAHTWCPHHSTRNAKKTVRSPRTSCTNPRCQFPTLLITCPTSFIALIYLGSLITSSREGRYIANPAPLIDSSIPVIKRHVTAAEPHRHFPASAHSSESTTLSATPPHVHPKPPSI